MPEKNELTETPIRTPEQECVGKACQKARKNRPPEVSREKSLEAVRLLEVISSPSIKGKRPVSPSKLQKILSQYQVERTDARKQDQMQDT